MHRDGIGRRRNPSKGPVRGRYLYNFYFVLSSFLSSENSASIYLFYHLFLRRTCRVRTTLYHANRAAGRPDYTEYRQRAIKIKNKSNRDYRL